MPFLRLRRAKRPLPLLLPLVVGIGFIAAAALSAEPTMRFVGRATPVEATSIGSLGGADTGFTSFRYRTSDGAITRVSLRPGPLAPRFAGGQKVRLLYDPQQPGNARIDSIATLWLRPLILGVIGLLLAGFGVVLLARRRKQPSAG